MANRYPQGSRWTCESFARRGDGEHDEDRQPHRQPHHRSFPHTQASVEGVCVNARECVLCVMCVSFTKARWSLGLSLKMCVGMKAPQPPRTRSFLTLFPLALAAMDLANAYAQHPALLSGSSDTWNASLKSAAALKWTLDMDDMLRTSVRRSTFDFEAVARHVQGYVPRVRAAGGILPEEVVEPLYARRSLPSPLVPARSCNCRCLPRAHQRVSGAGENPFLEREHNEPELLLWRVLVASPLAPSNITMAKGARGAGGDNDDDSDDATPTRRTPGIVGPNALRAQRERTPLRCGTLGVASRRIAC